MQLLHKLIGCWHMIEEAFGHRVARETFEEILPDYYKIDNQLASYKGTNNRLANDLLNDIMNDEEKRRLENAFFGNNGWYRMINGIGMIELKLAAMSLEATNNIFTFDKDLEEKILDSINLESKEAQILMMSCYIKQKAVTYATMYNYLHNVRKTDKMSITLYRGINTPYKNEKYMFSGMESWTTNMNIAYRFARNGGFVLEKEYPIDQIFAGKRSTFKNSDRLYKHRGFYIRRESEMIVENYETIFDCSEGKGVRLAVDKEIY